jgi:PIN domain nuclease of toxin-antitoxin system
VILLDTHVLLWWQSGGKRLSARAAREIARAELVLVSPINCWEVAMLLAKDRIALDRDVFMWVSDLLATEGVDSAPLSPTAAVAAGLLSSAGFPGDPADRLLYATARDLNVPLVTKDGAIREYARAAKDVRTIW